MSYRRCSTIYRKNRALIKRRDDICAICGGYVDKTLPAGHPLSATIDHIIPVSKGGSDALDNLQLAHMCCNNKKSDREYSDVTKSRATNNASVRNLPQVFSIKKGD